MTEETKPSEESLALAAMFGAVLAGIALELKLANFERRHEIEVALKKGVGRAGSNTNVPGSAEWKAAVLAEIQRTAVI